MGQFQKIGNDLNNKLFMLREDLIPYSFGGNKARKAKLFFEEIDKGEYDSVVTYGSSHSNHCRIVANMSIARNKKCYIISPLEVSKFTFNSKFMEFFGAEIIQVPVEKVSETIENLLVELRKNKMNPYFIPGGGHGDIGTEAYVQCYSEIKKYERENAIFFDYIFFASGTGTTHAGLVCGQFINNDERKIIGLSIARKREKGQKVILDSVYSYLKGKKIAFSEMDIQKITYFIDEYVGLGYGKENEEVLATIKYVMKKYGIPLDSTYTGKAYYGMEQYLKKHQIQGKNVLFIHTGGTPLFFDDLKEF